MNTLFRPSFALRVTLIFTAVSGVWILISNRVTVLLTVDINQLIFLGTLQGWTRVAIIAVLLYVLLRREENHRRQVEKDLQAAQRFAQATIDALDAHLCVLDETGTIMFVNRAWQAFAEANPPTPSDAYLGDNYLEVCDQAVGLSSDEAARFAAGIREVMYGAIEQFTLEYPCDAPHEKRWFIGRVARFQDDSSPRVVVAHENITVRKQAEDRLCESESRFSSIFHSGPLAIATIRLKDNQFVEVNDEWQRLTGYSREQAVGRTPFDLQTWGDLSERGRMLNLLQEQGVVHDFEMQLRHRSGTIATLAMSATQIELAGELCVVSMALDVTSRKRAEAALRASEEHACFQACLLEAVGDVVLAIDTEGKITYWNQAAEAQFGWPAAEALGRSIFDMIPLPVQHQAVEIIERLRSGESWSGESLAKRRDGRSFSVQVTATPIHDAQGNVAGFIGVTRDITARRQMEEALQQSEMRYRAVVEEQTELIVRFRRDHTFLFVNEAYCRFFNKTRIELLDQQWQPVAMPEDIPLIEAQLRLLSPMNPVVQIENRVRAGDGEVHWMQFTNRGFFDEAGQLIEVQAVGRDITTRKQAESQREAALQALRESEEKFRSFIEQSSEGMVLLDEQGYIIEWNQAQERITGIPRVKALNAPFWDVQFHLLPPEHQPPGGPVVFKEALRDTFRTGQLPQRGSPFDVEIHAAAGERRTIQQVSFPIKMADGYRIGAIFRDITDRKQAEEALRRYSERLKVLHEVGRASLSAKSPLAIAELALDLLQQILAYQRATITWISAHTEEATGVTKVADRPGQMSSELRVAAYSAEQRLTLNVPLYSHSELIGTLNLQADRSAPFLPQDLEIAREAADELALAIQHTQLFEQVRTGRDRMELLSRRLLDMQETERRTIARELHDEIGQALTVVKIDLQRVQHSVTGPVFEQLAESVEVVNQALQQVRDLSLDLRPSLLDDLGLPAALRWYVDRQAQRAGLLAELNVDTVRKRLLPDLETVCFRVVQEAVTNIIRHAHAQRIYVELVRHEAQLLLTIQDDGRGFEVADAHAHAVSGASLGLLGMEERVWLSNGEIEIESMPNKGTTVRARLPYRPLSP